MSLLQFINTENIGAIGFWRAGLISRTIIMKFNLLKVFWHLITAQDIDVYINKNPLHSYL